MATEVNILILRHCNIFNDFYNIFLVLFAVTSQAGPAPSSHPGFHNLLSFDKCQ